MGAGMSDNPLDSIPTFDRLSLRAVLVQEGEDPTAALAQAGLIDAVVVPAVLGDLAGLSGGILGDGVTPNVTAVLETGPGGEEAFESAASQPAPARQVADDTPPPGPVTTTLPAAFGMQPLAPVRKVGCR